MIFFGDVTHVLGPFGTYARQVLHAKTAALVYPNIAGITDGAAAIAQSLKRAGVTVKQVAYDESSTDLIGPLTSAGAMTADMVIPYSDSSGCVNLAKGLKQLGITDAKKIVSAPLCLNGQVSAGLGGDWPIWTYAIASSLFGDPTDPGMPPYMKVAGQLESPADTPDPWNIVAFSQILTTDRFLNQLGYSQHDAVGGAGQGQDRSKARWRWARPRWTAASTRPPRPSATTAPSSSNTSEGTSSAGPPPGCSRRRDRPRVAANPGVTGT